MVIRVMGPGCNNCKQLLQNVFDAAAEANVIADIGKIEDMREIAMAGVLRTPALSIEGKVVSSGRVLSVAEVKKLIEEQG